MSGGREALVRIRLLPDGSLEFEGSGTAIRRCRPEELGRDIVAMLSDPNLPPLESTGSAGSLIDMYANLMLPPHLRPLARPSAHALRDLYTRAKSMFDAGSDGSWARDQDNSRVHQGDPYQQQAQHEYYRRHGGHPPPQPPGPPPPPPRGMPHRRGRAVG